MGAKIFQVQFCVHIQNHNHAQVVNLSILWSFFHPESLVRGKPEGSHCDGVDSDGRGCNADPNSSVDHHHPLGKVSSWIQFSGSWMRHSFYRTLTQNLDCTAVFSLTTLQISVSAGKRWTMQPDLLHWISAQLWVSHRGQSPPRWYSVHDNNERGGVFIQQFNKGHISYQ